MNRSARKRSSSPSALTSAGVETRSSGAKLTFFRSKTRSAGVTGASAVVGGRPPGRRLQVSGYHRTLRRDRVPVLRLKNDDLRGKNGFRRLEEPSSGAKRRPPGDRAKD